MVSKDKTAHGVEWSLPQEIQSISPDIWVIACPDCDLLNKIARDGMQPQFCARCDAVLYRPRRNSIERSFALTIAAFLLFLLSNSFPFLAMKSAGFVQETIMPTGILELWNQGEYLLSCIILLTCFVFPLLQMIGLFYILAPLYTTGRPAPRAIAILRMVKELAPWSMMEVFMIGILVALVKLGHMAVIIPGISVFSFGALIFVMTSAVISLDFPLLWDKLDGRR